MPIIQVYLNDDEFVRYATEAKKKGTTVSAVFKEQTQKQPTIKEIVKDNDKIQRLQEYIKREEEHSSPASRVLSKKEILEIIS